MDIDDDIWDYLPPLDDMYEHLHYPPSRDAFTLARKRLLFENMLLLQIGLVHDSFDTIRTTATSR